MKPVFIGGCERSGTTMLGAMLGAHPRYLCPPEMPFKMKLLTRSEGGTLSQDQVRSILSGDLKAEVQGWRIPEQTWAFDTAPASTVVLEIVQSYGSLLGRNGPEVWIDHTPNNVRWAATLAQEFPEAAFVHIVRDGRAIAASLMKLDWGPNNVYRAAHQWLEGLSFGLAAESALGSRCVRVRYEDLLREPEITLRLLCASLEIQFDPVMASGAGYSVNSYSKRQHALVGKPPIESRLSAWEHELSRREIEIFEAVVSDQLQLLGYEPRFGASASPASRSERWSSGLLDLFKRRVLNRLRRRHRIRTARRLGS